MVSTRRSNRLTALAIELPSPSDQPALSKKNAPKNTTNISGPGTAKQRSIGLEATEDSE